MRPSSTHLHFVSLPPTASAQNMAFARSLFKSLLIISSSFSAIQTSRALDVPLPQNAVSSGNVVYGNFLGISFELSFLDKYCEFSIPEKFRSVH